MQLAGCAFWKLVQTHLSPQPCSQLPCDGPLSTTMQVYEKLSPSVNEYVEKATPYVKGAYTEASKVIVPFANDVASKGVPIVTVRSSSLNQP